MLVVVVLVVAVLIEPSLVVCELASLPSKDETQEPSKAVGSGFEESVACTTRLFSLVTRIGCVQTVPRSDTRPISNDAPQSSARFDCTITLVSSCRLMLYVPLIALSL